MLVIFDQGATSSPNQERVDLLESSRRDLGVPLTGHHQESLRGPL